jgi:hypothetical protein
VEQSATEGQALDQLKEAELNASIAAGAPMRTLYGFGPADEPLPDDGNAAAAASFVANSAANAADAAQKPPQESSFPALQAYGFARSSLEAADNEDAVLHLQKKFFDLRRIARRQGWSHETVVPPGIFDRLEEEYEDTGRTPWWKFWK